jgi:hypothetical protein
MNIEQYYFPVEEKCISLQGNADIGSNETINGYKAIVRPDTDEVISVVKNTYKLVPNRELIEPFLEQVDKLDVAWYADESHSFSASNRMRLQITFPDIILKDRESVIPMSLYLHNSYDMSEGVRMFWGGIRSVCTNGMVFGHLLGRFYARHTSGFDFEKFAVEFENAIDKIGRLQARIFQLESQPLPVLFATGLEDMIGKRIVNSAIGQNEPFEGSKWELLNALTRYISHEVDKKRRADLQLKVSKAFQL